MELSGTLRKRKRRNLAKVAGLTVIPYDEKDDVFNWRNIYALQNQNDPNNASTTTSKNETRIRMAALLSQNRASSGSRSGYARVTRNPMYHPKGEDDSEDSDNSITPEQPNEQRTDGGYQGDRPHLLDRPMLIRLRILVLVGAISGNYPWYWDSKKCRIEKAGPQYQKLWKIFWSMITIQTFFLTFFQIYSFSQRVSLEQKTYRGFFMNLYGVLWYIYVDCTNLTMYKYKEKIRSYINTMLQFNEAYVEKYLINLDEHEPGGRIVMNVSIPSNLSQIIASISLFLVMPFQPWFLTSYIYPKPWYYLIPGALHEFIFVSQIITSYLIIAWVAVAHPYTVEFWLRETHNHSDSGMTLDSIRHPRAAFETYRTLQVLNTRFNDCMAPMALPLLKFISSTALIPTGYVLVRSMNHIFIEEFPGILTYPVSVIDCATAPFAILTMCAEMNDIASGFIDSWCRTKQKDCRRMLMSCPTLTVKVGSCYHITVSTTITFFQVIFGYITDCVITFP